MKKKIIKKDWLTTDELMHGLYCFFINEVSDDFLNIEWNERYKIWNIVKYNLYGRRNLDYIYIREDKTIAVRCIGYDKLKAYLKSIKNKRVIFDNNDK